MNSYSNKKNAPLFIGIFLILAIAVTIFLIQQGILTITRAKPSSIPQNIQITNISDSSFTVIFTTELKTSAAIRIPEGETANTIIYDDRDKSKGVQNDYFSHHITIPNLKPKQTYSFVIISEGKEYASPAEYLITTGPAIDSPPPSQNPLYGKLLLPDGSMGVDTIVTAKSNDSQVISSITNDSGNYIIPTNSLKTANLSEYQILDASTQIFLSFFREKYTAKITTDFELGQNLPVITLNQAYAFLPQTDSLESQPSEGFDSIDEPSETSAQPSVISPRTGQSFIDQRPTFSGTGGANRKVIISIPSANISSSVNISSQGRWTFRSETELSQGEHTVIFTIQDENGINIVISRSFSIFPSGSQVAQSATPSATPIFTPTPTQSEPTPTTASPTPTIEMSITPTISVEPTISPTEGLTPTPTEITPTPTFIPTSSPLPPIDKPGDMSSTTLLAVFSIILIIAGAAIFFAL